MFRHQHQEAVDRLLRSTAHYEHGTNSAVQQWRTDLFKLQDFNWVGYISRSLRAAGIRDQDLDSAVSDIVVKLLHSPGSLFRRWKGDSPILARFKTSVKNSSINAARRNRRASRRQILSFSEPGVDATARAEHPGETVHNFFAWLRLRRGPESVAVLQHIMDGGDVKDLVGQDGMTSYRVKKLVRELKGELLAYGERDPELLQRVKKALEKQEEVLRKRFGDKRREVSTS